MADIFEELIRIRAGGGRAALATIVGVKGSSPGKNSMKMLVREDGTFVGTVGGGCMEAEVWEAAKKVMETEEPSLLSFTLTEDDMPDSGLICGGTVSVFVESVGAPTAYLFGAGHLSRAICQVARLAGFRVAVIDDRPQFANRERFPLANDVHV
jgi:xanthine dehydrogenase accessory factor